MLKNLVRGKSLIALFLPLAISGLALAGGTDCPHANATAAASETGHHCDLAKNVKKHATMTDDGAVVTMIGKTAEAVEHIKTHLASHEKGEECKDCPFSMANVTTTVKMTDKGGEVTLKGTTPESIKAVQEWAKQPAASCCDKHKDKAA